jgi:AcrR family transcriptional regulator
MPRAKLTEQEIKAMRGRILDAAFDLLRHEGPEGLSIRKIANRVGVSHMTLYGYFENRAAISDALRQRAFDQMDAFHAESLHRAQTGDALAQVRASLERFVQLSHDHPMLYRLVWRREVSLEADPQQLTKTLEHLSQLIRLCIVRGQCIERDPALAAAIVFSGVNGTLLLYHSIPTLGKAEQAELESETIEAAITYLTH